MDYTILKFINSFAGRWKTLDILGIFFANWLILIMPIIIFLAYWFSGRKKQIISIALEIILGIFVVVIFRHFAGMIFPRLRPFVVLPEIKKLGSLLSFADATRSSFFSNHVAISFIMALVVIFNWPKLGALLLVFPFLIGLARIFTGVHWPVDILGGFIFGGISFFLVYYLNLMKLFRPIIKKFTKK